MAASSVIAALRVNLGLNSASFETGLSRSEKRARGFQSNMMGIAKRIGVAFAAMVSVRATANAADQWSDLSARVGNAVGSMEAAPVVMDRIQQIARKSYSALGQTTESFLANSTALKELGFSTEKQLDFTEALNNALVINGTRGQRAASVTKAISDAMATGKLSGDGFNTILKDGDRVAQALAKELGTTVGGLRQMQKDGKITSDVISRSLVGSLEDLRREAGDMPATIGDGITLIRNSFVTLIGAFDRVFMASGGVANAFVAVADAMSSLATFITNHGSTIAAVFQQIAVTAAVAGGVIAAKYAVAVGVSFVRATIVAYQQTILLNMTLGATTRTAAVASGAVKLLSASLIALRGALIATGIGAAIVAAGYLISKFIDLVRATGSFKQALSDMGALAGAIWTAMIDSAGAIPPALSGVWAVVKGDFQRFIASLSDLWAKFLSTIIADFGTINMLEIGGFKWEIDTPWKGALDEALTSANAFTAEMTAEADAAGDALASSMEDSASRIKNAFAPVGAMWRSLTRTEMFGPDKPVEMPDVPPGTPPGGAGDGGKGAKKVKEVVDKLREQFTLLKDTKGMTEAQVSTWQALRDAGVGAASAIGREITKLTQGIASMSVLNDLADQLAEARATAGMNDLETSIWQKQREAGADAGSANGQIIDQQMRQIQNMKDLKSATNQWRDSIGGALSEFITKGGSFKDVLKSILSGLLDIVANTAFNSMFNSLGSGGGFGKILGSFGIGRNANGTNNWRGGWTSLHERGGEIVNLPKGGQVIPNDISKRMADAAGKAGTMRVLVGVDPKNGSIAPYVEGRAGEISAGMLEDYDSGLGGKVRHHATHTRNR